MFALLALVCFVIALFHGHLGSFSDWVTLGLLFISAHLLFGNPLPWNWPWHRNPNQS